MGQSTDGVTAMFDSLISINSIFLHGGEVWGSAYQYKYICLIDESCRSAMKSGRTSKFTPLADAIKCSDIKLWGRNVRARNIVCI